MGDMKFERVIRYVLEMPWAIKPEALGVILDILAFRAEGGVRSQEEIDELIGPDERPAEIRRGKVAVVPLHGMIMPRADMFMNISGGTSMQKFAATLKRADQDPKVATIVIDVDSPGGTVDMVPETAEMIRNLKTATVAVANTGAASAAYWLAAQADEFVVTPSGEVGSIGVWTAHEDVSKANKMAGRDVSLISAGKYKVEGNPFEPLGDEARAAMQSKVDYYFDQFVADVARGRGVSADVVRNGYGQGRMVVAPDALREGMVDRIATLDQIIAERSGDSRPVSIAASAEIVSFFDNPNFGIPGTDQRLRYDPDAQRWSCPVTVSGDHIFGHVAPMGVCLRGRPASCITPPDGDVEGFMRGYAPAAGGQRTGVIVVGGSHADVGVGVIAASKHYDKTGRAGADVRVGRDAYGIWFSGMIRPGTSKEDRYALAASDVSGHWEIGQRGLPVLVGLPAVNVGGFPKGYLTADEVAQGIAASLRIDDPCIDPEGFEDWPTYESVEQLRDRFGRRTLSEIIEDVRTREVVR